MKKYRLAFIGRQANAIGITYQIYDTYKANSLGEALFMLYTDYELIGGLTAKENNNTIDKDVISKTKLIPVDYPKRQTSPTTGSYKYYRYEQTQHTKF